jgi:hypothetical protein
MPRSLLCRALWYAIGNFFFLGARGPWAFFPRRGGPSGDRSWQGARVSRVRSAVCAGLSARAVSWYWYRPCTIRVCTSIIVPVPVRCLDVRPSTSKTPSELPPPWVPVLRPALFCFLRPAFYSRTSITGCTANCPCVAAPSFVGVECPAALFHFRFQCPAKAKAPKPPAFIFICVGA